jgi:hypothetical protein
MPTTSLSKDAENQFLSATSERYPLMSEILADTLPRVTAAIGANLSFLSVMSILVAINGKGRSLPGPTQNWLA